MYYLCGNVDGYVWSLDSTNYSLLKRTIQIIIGQEILKIEPEGITLLAKQAMHNKTVETLDYPELGMDDKGNDFFQMK